MTISMIRHLLIAVAVLGLCLATGGGPFAAEITLPPVASASNDGIGARYMPRMHPDAAPMSVAQMGLFGDNRELARGDECPVGSGAYCSDESPHCFMCRGEYACCWTSEVWRCCP